MSMEGHNTNNVIIDQKSASVLPKIICNDYLILPIIYITIHMTI